MSTVANTADNNAKAFALKKISETKWVGNTTHPNMQACLMAINLQSSNSGWYKPTAVRVAGVTGWFMLNEDGSLFCEARVIVQDDMRCRIEYMTNAGFNDFEKYYMESINKGVDNTPA